MPQKNMHSKIMLISNQFMLPMGHDLNLPSKPCANSWSLRFWPLASTYKAFFALSFMCLIQESGKAQNLIHRRQDAPFYSKAKLTARCYN